MNDYTWKDGAALFVFFMAVLYAFDVMAAEALPNATKEQLCIAGYSKTVRPTVAQIARWKRANIGKLVWKEYVVDHIIPLAIGGTPMGKNLQLQTHRDSKAKDILENRAHRDLCQNRATLIEVQSRFHDDIR